MPIQERLPLLLMLACGAPTPDGTDACEPTVTAPTEEEVAGCEGADWLDPEFAGCCDVWFRACEAACDSDCEWICNG